MKYSKKSELFGITSLHRGAPMTTVKSWGGTRLWCGRTAAKKNFSWSDIMPLQHHHDAVTTYSDVSQHHHDASLPLRRFGSPKG